MILGMAFVEQHEGYIGHTVLLKMFDVFAMNGGGIRAGVHLGYDTLHPQLREVDLFKPADDLLSFFRLIHRNF